MSDVAVQEEAQLAFQTEREIKQIAGLLREGWTELAERLYRFHEMRMWIRLGHDSFDAWIADPEVDIDRSWAYQLIRNWRELVVHREATPKQLKTCEPSKITVVLPAVRRGYVALEEALEDVRTLSRSDLRERYGAEGGGTEPSPNGARPDTGTSYNATREPAYARCPTCGSRVREEEIARG